ncbi:MAG: RNA 2',3'-cyclic phosphodiesterase [Oligoflexia bacterium]|nr:RNA 2',3'-cyclic phosphodiesterase [Oligoflexia bacterium]
MDGLLRIGLPEAKWCEGDQIHLTLRFIGEVDGTTFKEIANLLSEIKFHEFDLSLSGVGYFASRGTVRVIWAGVKKCDELIFLQKRIANKLIHYGLEPEEKKFSPHITLARTKDLQVFKIGPFIEYYNLYKSDQFKVNEFHLYSSKLTVKGSIYRKEYTYISSPN